MEESTNKYQVKTYYWVRWLSTEMEILTFKKKMVFFEWDNFFKRVDIESILSVANKTFSVGRSMSWRSEGHSEPPGGPGKMHISTSKKH